MPGSARLAGATVLSLALIPALPTDTFAQRRGRGHGQVVVRPVARPAVRSVVYVGVGRGYRPYGFYPAPFGLYSWYGDPFYPYGFYPYGPYGFYPGSAGAGYLASGSLRIQVEPKQARVYVNGYLAGTVDDFDGFFQRLSLPAGEQEVTIYLEGFRPVTERLYLAPGTTYRLRHVLERLAPGEPAPPPPAPLAGASRGRPRPGPPPDEPLMPSNHGQLAIRVQPPDADVLIDGEPWQRPRGLEPLVVSLPEGRHRVVIRKDGYEAFSGEIEVRAGETASLNVSLPGR
jgi:hypothetical protein